MRSQPHGTATGDSENPGRDEGAAYSMGSHPLGTATGDANNPGGDAAAQHDQLLQFMLVGNASNS